MPRRLAPLEAIQMFIGRRDLEGCTSTRILYRSVLGCIDTKGARRGNLLLALDAAGINDVRDVTTSWLQQWYQSSAWNKYALTSLKQHWIVIRILFNFLHLQGVIPTNPAAPIKPVRGNGHFHNIPFTPAEYQSILNKASDVRLKCFVELLRWTRMDIEDAIMFSPAASMTKAH